MRPVSGATAMAGNDRSSCGSSSLCRLRPAGGSSLCLLRPAGSRAVPAPSPFLPLPTLTSRPRQRRACDPLLI